jgi:hypothetical protein
MVFGESAEPPLGFAMRTDIQRNDAMLRLTFRPPVAALRRFDVLTFGTYIAHTDGALQDWGIGPALDLTFKSGENVTLYRLQAFTVLDSSFDLADRLIVQPGSFQNSQTGVFFRTAAQRPVSLVGNVQHHPFYGGALYAVSGTLNVAIGARGAVGLTRVFNDATVPAGHLLTNVSALRLGYAFSTRATMSTTIQYDALDHIMNANVRLVYMYRPGSELFVVFNEERERGVAPSLQPRTALVKLTYLARF